MLGLMQNWPLTVDKFLRHAAEWHGGREVVSRTADGSVTRSRYADIFDRARRLSNALLSMGIAPGDRCATLAWNNQAHLEAWYGVMGIGAVCHTLNPRLFTEQLCYVINHAEDKIIMADPGFLDLLLERRDKLPSVRRIIALCDRSGMPPDAPEDVLCLEELLDAHTPDVRWGEFEEGTAAGLCYTSGTTGDPKGVLYSHRSNFLHTLVTLGKDVMGLSSTDSVLAVVPMFHANGWGLPFSCPAAGAKLVLPGQRLDGASLYELLETEAVTFSAAVPTVWHGLLGHLKDTGQRLTTLKRVLIGGSAVPESIVRCFEEDHGVVVAHAWGMTETSPVGTVSSPTARTVALPADERRRYALTQGRPPIGVELKLADDRGASMPHDGATAGRLTVRGPYIAARYFRAGGADPLDADGFFDTGDIATIDPDGFMRIADRAKDIIKSGGEWISSIDIENIVAGHPAVALCAVVGVPHPKWDERPVLVVKPAPGVTPDRAELLGFLEGRIARWWMPDDVVFVDEIPLGATGKIDKKAIRESLRARVPSA